MNPLDASYDRSITLMLEGGATVEDLVSLAVKNSAARHVVTNRLLDYGRSTDALANSRIKPLLELAWRLHGPSDCIRHFRPLESKFFQVQTIIGEKLRNEPDSFDENDFQILAKYPSWVMFSTQIQEIRSQRLKSEVASIQKIPAELTRDVQQVKRRISIYGFGDDLNAALDKVDQGLAGTGDAFDQAALLKHLRSFFEQLVEKSSLKLQQAKSETKNNTNLTKFGQAMDFLKLKDVLTEKMYDLGKGLYGVLSNEGVHPMTAEAEYVRLCRNMLVEFSLVLLFELDRRLTDYRPQNGT